MIHSTIGRVRAILGTVLVSFPLLVPLTARAEVTVQDYLAYNQDTDTKGQMVQMYILGIASALMSANADLQAHHRRLLYCQPGHLTLNLANYISMLNDQIGEGAPYGVKLDERTSIAMVLLDALQKRLPCNAPGN